MPDRTTERTTLMSSQAITDAAAVNSEKMYVADYTEALIFLNVSAVSGTNPTLDPVVQVSDDDGTTWYTISRTWIEADGTTITRLTNTTGDGNGTGQYVCQVSNIGRHLRVRFPAAGGDSPSFTIVAKAEAKN